MAFEFSVKFGKKEKEQLKSYTGTSSAPFYPIQNTIKSNPKALIELFNIIGDVNAYIRYISDVGSKVNIKHYREQGNGKLKDLGNTEQLKLIYNPNRNTSKEDFFKFIIESLFVVGYAPIQKINTSAFGVTSLYQLPCESVYPIPQYSLDQYGTPSSNVNPIDNPVVKYYYHLDGGKIEPINVDDMIYIKTVTMNLRGVDYYRGRGRLYAAVNSINSLKYLYTSINNILDKSGVLGFVKRNTRNGEIVTVIDPEEKALLEEKFSQYSASKGSGIMFTGQDLQYIKVFDGLSQFMPVELKDSELETIANCLGGFPRALMNGSKQTTYNNVKEFQKILYVNIEKPIISLICSYLTKGLSLPDNEFFEGDYSDVESLQTDQKQYAETKKTQFDYYAGLLDKGLITPEYMNQQLELPTPPNIEENATPTI